MSREDNATGAASKVLAWDKAIENKNVAPQTYVEVAFLSSKIESAAIRYKKVREIFEKQYGKIDEQIIGNWLACGVILTNKNKLFASYVQEDTGPLYRLVSYCVNKAGEAGRLLAGGDLSRALQRYFVILCRLLSYLDEGKGGGHLEFAKSTEEEVHSYLKDRTEEADAFFDRALKRRAYIDYFLGMLLAIGVIVPSAYAIGWVTSPEVWPLMLSLGAGATGAMISVLSSMTRGKLELESDAGRILILLFGAFRVVVGSILGLVAYGMLKSGFLHIEVPDEAAGGSTFFATVAFVAGFFEREARHRIESTAKSLLGNSAPKDT